MLNSFIREKTDSTVIQFVRYFVVGGTAFVVDTTFLYIFTEWVGFYYLVSKVFSFTAGLTTNYLLSTFWVFSQRRLKSRRLEFIVNALIAIVGLGINLIVLRFATETLGIYYLISNVFAAGVAFVWNFFAKKKILFSVRKDSGLSDKIL